MKDKKFIIKVGDLLKEGGKVDAIEFEQQTLSELPNIDKNGISGTILLRSLDQDSLYVTIENMSCTLDEICDRCGKNFKRDIESQEYTSRFVINEKIRDEEQSTSDEEIFVINSRSETVDLEPMIFQAIQLEEPFAKYCPDCEKEIDPSYNSEDEELDPPSWNNVVFR